MFDALVWSLVNWIVLSTICSSFPAFLNYLDDFSMMVWVKLQQIWWKEKINSQSQLQWTDELPFRFPKEGFPFDEVQILFAQCKMIRHSPAQSHSIPPYGTEHCRHTVSVVSLISLIFYFYQILFNEGTRKKKKKNVENSTLGLTPPLWPKLWKIKKKKKLKKP